MESEQNARALQTSQQNDLRKLNPLRQESFERAIAYLASDIRPSSSSKLLPPDVCERVIAMCGEAPPMQPDDCAKAAAALMACYVAVTVNIPEKDKVALMRVFEKVFSAYPRFAAVKVCDVNTGLPRSVGFVPKPSELSDALEAEVTKRRAYAVKAQWHIDEASRRAKERAVDEACARGDPKERAASVARVLSRVDRKDGLCASRS